MRRVLHNQPDHSMSSPGTLLRLMGWYSSQPTPDLELFYMLHDELLDTWAYLLSCHLGDAPTVTNNYADVLHGHEPTSLVWF